VTFATLHTTLGRIRVELFDNHAPKTVRNFIGLAEGTAEYTDPRTRQPGSGPYYDGVLFHRVIEGFMAQTGDPTGTGTGGSDLPDLKAEFNAEPHVRGVCSMARTNAPHSANSQFFIVFDDARFLDKQYTVWGKVTEGMENVDKIKRGEPVRDPDRIVSMKVAADTA
jgi:peptidyl-prolyl cis-trans isomerase B (cyclophilin B)